MRMAFDCVTVTLAPCGPPIPRSGVTQVNFPTWILNGAFNSGFTMKLMRKDVRLAQELIGQTGLTLPLSAEVARLWALSAETIGDDEDFNRIVGLGAAPRNQA